MENLIQTEIQNKENNIKFPSIPLLRLAPQLEQNVIGPTLDIDYNNIFGDLSKFVAFEKHLELTYRPFVCTVDFNFPLNLGRLSKRYLNTMVLQHPKDHPRSSPTTGIIRFTGATATLYASGHMMCQGLTAELASHTMQRLRTVIEQSDRNGITNFVACNIVNASFCLPFKIDLKAFCEEHNCLANLEVRPFVTFMYNDHIRFAVFPNGFVLVLLCDTLSECRAAIAEGVIILAKFQIGYSTASERNGMQCGDISYKLLWEHKLNEDRDGQLLYS